MIFLGDMAVPFGVDVSAAVATIDRIRGGRPLAVNLEGGLIDDRAAAAGCTGIYNSPAALDLLEGSGAVLATLANNHILDAGLPPSRTIDRLAAKGIAACGAGDDIGQATRAARIEIDGVPCAFLAFGWKPIGCRPATDRSPGTAPLSTETILSAVDDHRRDHPEDRIVLSMHWNYELELYPQPAHRRLARAAIERGVAAVIGHHSHRVQGVEFHQGAPIVYGLGNGFFPQGVFFDGRLVYPDVCSRQLAFAWDPADGACRCHWLEYRREDHSLHEAAVPAAPDSAAVAELTPFAGQSDADYLDWFRTHRLKSFLLPVYDDDTRVLRTRLCDAWLDVRNWISRHRPRRG